MPTYVYSDGNHTQESEHSMAENPKVFCERCGKPMHRVPQIVSVNWNGLPPHKEGARSPVVQHFIDTASERRAKYLDTERNK